MNNIELQQHLEVSLSMQRSLASDLNQVQAEMEQARIAIGSLGWMTLGEAITLTMPEKDKQIAELQRKVEGLAAENVTARNAVQAFCDVVQSNTDAICEEVGQEGVKAILAAMSATGNMTGTDAALAEIRAQGRAEGVKMFAARMRKYADDEDSCNRKCSLNLTAERAENYSSWMRKEAGK